MSHLPLERHLNSPSNGVLSVRRAQSEPAEPLRSTKSVLSVTSSRCSGPIRSAGRYLPRLGCAMAPRSLLFCASCS